MLLGDKREQEFSRAKIFSFERQKNNSDLIKILRLEVQAIISESPAAEILRVIESFMYCTFSGSNPTRKRFFVPCDSYCFMLLTRDGFAVTPKSLQNFEAWRNLELNYRSVVTGQIVCNCYSRVSINFVKLLFIFILYVTVVRCYFMYSDYFYIITVIITLLSIIISWIRP